MPQSRVALALAAFLALPLASVLATAQDRNADRDAIRRNSEEFSLWAKEQIARLNQELDEVKARLNELGERAGPTIDEAREGVAAMRDKYEAERPALEAA